MIFINEHSLHIPLIITPVSFIFKSIQFFNHVIFLSLDSSFAVLNLKPNGEYEFRVIARTADGPSEPSLSSGFIRLKPSVPSRLPPMTKTESSFSPPGQPQVRENFDYITWKKLVFFRYNVISTIFFNFYR